MSKYSINFAWSDEDGGFIATSPEFEGLVAFGETYEEALQAMNDSIEMALEFLEEDGDPVPEPIKAKTYSGNLRIRLPKSLHQKLSTQAQLEGVSLNTHIVSLLSGSATVKEISEQVRQDMAFFADWNDATIESALSRAFAESINVMEGVYKSENDSWPKTKDWMMPDVAAAA